MPDPVILKPNQKISAPHYAGVTRAAYSEVHGNGSNRTTAEHGSTINFTESHRNGVFKLDEDSYQHEVNGVDEPYASALAHRMSMNTTTQALVTGNVSANRVRIVFPMKGTEKSCTRKKGEVVIAHYVPRFGAWVSDSTYREPDIWIRNGTGSTINAGRVVGIGSAYRTDPVAELFKCDLAFYAVNPPTSTHIMGQFAILLNDCAADETVGAVNTGIVVMQVNIRDSHNTYVDVKPGDGSMLQSNAWGWGKILWRESGTGTKWAKIDFNRHETKFRGVASGTITAESTGTAIVYSARVATAVTETVRHDWMTGATDIANATQMLVEWFDDERALVVVNAACA